MGRVTELRQRLHTLLEAGGFTNELLRIVDHLRQIGGPEAAMAIADVLACGDAGVSLHVGLALHILGQDGRMACLEALSDPRRARNAAEWIMNYGDKGEKPRIATLTTSSDVTVRRAALEILDHWGSGPPEIFVDALRDEDAFVRAAAARALGRRHTGVEHPGLCWYSPSDFYRGWPLYIDFPSEPLDEIPPPINVLPYWCQYQGGAGTWETIPAMELALRAETDRWVRCALLESHVAVVLKHCPPHAVDPYAKLIGEEILEFADKGKLSGAIGFLDSADYESFCRRGNLPTSEPFYRALVGDRFDEHLAIIRHLLTTRHGETLDFRDRWQFEDRQEKESIVPLALIDSLARSKRPEVAGVLVEKFSWAVAGGVIEQECRRALLSLGEPIVTALAERVSYGKVEALLRDIGAPAVEPLVHVAGSSERGLDIRVSAVRLLAAMGDRRAVKPLKQMARVWSNVPAEVRVAAKAALRDLRSKA